MTAPGDATPPAAWERYRAALHTLAALGATDEPLSDLLDTYSRYVLSGEVNSTVADPAATLAAVASAYAETPGASVDHLDGLTVTTDDMAPEEVAADLAKRLRG